MRFSSTTRALRRAALTSIAALAVTGAAAVAPTVANAQLALDGFSAPMLDRNGNEETRAGARAFVVENHISVERDDPLSLSGSLRDVVVDMPVGFVGDPSEIPTCPMRTTTLRDCPRESQIGMFELTTFMTFWDPVYNMEVPKGQPARFGIPAVQGAANIFFDASVRPGDNGITVTSADTTHLYPVGETKMVLWGVPADPAHDADRGGPAGSDPVPFLTLPTKCDGKPLVTRVRTNSWQDASRWVERTYEAPPLTGCEQLDFAPEVKVQPDHTVAGAPSGYTVELTQRLNDSATGRATAHLKDAVVALPDGVTLNPGAADGLDACSEAQVGLGKEGAATCPQASKIGEVTIDTPILDEPLTGGVYQAQQNANPFGSTLAIYMVPENERYGVRMKLAGEIATDPATGRVTTTFRDNPEQPFSKLTLKLKGGDRAVLSNPTMCGAKTTDWSITSWAQPSNVVTGTDTFTIDRAPAGGACDNTLFAPAFAAGVTDPVAGKSSPFTMTFGRPDGHQNLWTIEAKLPTGLLGKVGVVELCSEAHANLGACGPASQVGRVVAQVGSGSHPLSVPQPGRAPTRIFMSGPYGGAPYSMSLQVPAQAGPLNLGTVVARVGLFVDDNDASITARLIDSRVFNHAGRLMQTVSGGMPQIIEGVPMDYRALRVAIDVPGFMVNPTSCEPKAIHAAITSIAGLTANATSRFQVGECGALGLDPKLSMTFTGSKEMKTGRHPGVEANLGTISGDANLKQVRATLPLAVALDPNNAKALCEPGDAPAGKCPAESIIGNATATTPLLSGPVSGPVYFVKGFRTGANGRQIATLPKLFMRLAGQGVNINVWADSSVTGPVGKQRLVTTFVNVPDVPIDDFKLQVNSGENGILKATANVCGAPKSTDIEFTGHNGKVKRTTIQATSSGCKPQVVSSSSTRTSVSVRVGGIGAGRLTLSGKAVKTTRRTIRSADAATVKTRLKLTTAQSRRLAQGRSVRIPVRVAYKPKKGKTVNLRRNVTVEGVERS